MRLVINAAFAFTLVAFATGTIRPIHDARLDRMRVEFAGFKPALPALTRVWR